MRIEATGMTSLEFGDTGLHHFFKGQTKRIKQDCHIPQDISQFILQLVRVQWFTIEVIEELLEMVGDFTNFTG